MICYLPYNFRAFAPGIGSTTSYGTAGSTDSSTGAPSGTDSAKGRSTDESNGYDESLLSIRAMALVQSSLEKIPHPSLTRLQ